MPKYAKIREKHKKSLSTVDQCLLHCYFFYLHSFLRLQSLAAASAVPSSSLASSTDPLTPVRSTDISGFLRNERENALLSVMEETRQETFAGK